MTRVSVLGACLASLVATCALGATAASAAAPEFGRCFSHAGGRFTDVGCTTAAPAGKGKFEWAAGVLKGKFTLKLSGASSVMEPVAGTAVICRGMTGSGEYTGPKTISYGPLSLTGCTAAGLECASAGAAVGEIVTSPLEGVLGVAVIGASSRTNKLALEWHAHAGSNFAEFTCASLPIVMRGSVLHPLEANKMLSTRTEKLTAAKAEQKPDGFAGEALDAHILESSTNGSAFAEFGWTLPASASFEEALEASTVN